jgi:peptidoglycan/xylan/chitin deacetylase (PgdA/CDA1 family)
MSFKHKLLAAGYPLFRSVDISRNLVGSIPGKRLRVLVFHDIPPNGIRKFADQIKWIKRRWEFIDPETFSSIVMGNQPLLEDSLLLTFDDGFYSNYFVAVNILDPLNIKAVFFVVSGFIDTKTEIESRNFISKGIRRDLSPDMMPLHWKSMSWADLRNLQSNGHKIGAHTATHARLSEINTDKELISEIVESTDYIERQINKKVNDFAFTFGDYSSLSKNAFAIVANRFQYVYTSLRGDNATKTQPKMLCRDTVAPNDSNWLIGSLLEGGADHIYKKSRSSCCGWLEG